jgi:hypothetical protein
MRGTTNPGRSTYLVWRFFQMVMVVGVLLCLTLGWDDWCMEMRPLTSHPLVVVSSHNPSPSVLARSRQDLVADSSADGQPPGPGVRQRWVSCRGAVVVISGLAASILSPRPP